MAPPATRLIITDPIGITVHWTDPPAPWHPGPMVRILAFARYRALLGFESLEWPAAPTLGDLLAHDRFHALPEDALLAVNQSFADRSTALRDGDEVALLPPVSGG